MCFFGCFCAGEIMVLAQSAFDPVWHLAWGCGFGDCLGLLKVTRSISILGKVDRVLCPVLVVDLWSAGTLHWVPSFVSVMAPC